jgi:hypothetical protein
MTPPDAQWGPVADQRPADPGHAAHVNAPPDTQAPSEGRAITRVARKLWPAVASVASDLGRAVAYFILIPLIVGLCVVIPLSIYAGVQIAHQYDTLNQFCRDEVARDYLDASYWIATGASTNMFIQANQQRDQRLGPIQSCAVVARDNLFISFDHAVFTLSVTIKGTSHAGTVHMVSSDGQTWTIQSIDPGLHLDTP